MLIRISLIVAIVAALVTAGLNVVKVRDKITTLVSQRDTYHAQRDEARTSLAHTKNELAKTQNTLQQTQQELTSAKAARDKATAAAAAEKKQAQDLSTKLAKTTQERDSAQAQLAAYTATGYTAKQVGDMAKTIRSQDEALNVTKQENLVLVRDRDRLKNRLALYEGTNYVVTMRANLRGKVLVCDPKWDFVVLNIGEDQGVKQDGEMLVNRKGRLVAKIIVRTVDKDRSIANIMPGWKIGAVFEGDQVIPAHPTAGT